MKNVIRISEEHKDVTCENCGWSWDIEPKDKHPYLCHQCGHENTKHETDEGAGPYDAPAFQMEPDHVHFKHQYNEQNDNKGYLLQMERKSILVEQYGDEAELFKLASAYYRKNGKVMAIKVLEKILHTLSKRDEPHRAKSQEFPPSLHLQEQKGPNQKVRTIQKKLISKGYNLGKTGADGFWGKLTDKAWKDYQSKKGNSQQTNTEIKSKQVNKQLDYLKTNNLFKNERFTILDDKNSTVYAFNPNYELYKAYPVITGENSGDALNNQTITTFVKQNPNVILDALKKGLSKLSLTDFVHHIDNCYFNLEQNKLKQTPSGIFQRAGTIENFVNDAFLTAFVEKDYGKRYITWETLNGTTIPYGFHGTKNSERLKRFKLTDADLMSCKRKMSFGCINFRESDILDISKFITAGQKTIWLPNTTDGIVMVPSTKKVPEKTNKVTQYKMDNPRSLEIGKI
jgi:hypothetical protein